MKIPLFDLHIITGSTLESIIKKAAKDALAFRTKQMSVLLKENDRLAAGRPKRKGRIK